MLLIYITIFMTVVLTFWLMQAYTYNRTIDKYMLTTLSNSMMTVHERAIETTRNDILSSGQVFNLENILKNVYSSDELISNNFESQCFYEQPINSGNLISGNCYDSGSGGANAYDYDTNHYDVKSILTANPDSGWIQMVSYLDMSTGSSVEQRDLYASFVNRQGYNLNMGMVRSGDRNGDDYIVNTEKQGVNDRIISSMAWSNGVNDCASNDINGECFVLVTDISQIPLTPKQDILVDIDGVPETFEYENKTYNGALFDSSSYDAETLSFTVDDDLDATSNPSVNLYVSISGYSEDGSKVPAMNDEVSNGYNTRLLDVEDIEFVDSNGNVVDNEDNYTRNMKLRVSPNYNQIGGAYVTVTAVYEGNDAAEGSSTLTDSMTFLVMVEDAGFNCENDFLDSLSQTSYNGKMAYIIGDGGNTSDTTTAVNQLLCLSKIQNDVPAVLSSNYVLATDVDFDIGFSVSKTYQDENGNGSSSNKTSTYRYIKDMAVNVSYNNVDWDLDDNIDSTTTSGWVPIGDSIGSKVFTGSFYGNGHTIRNLYIRSSDNRAMGMFGYVSGSTINDITFDNTYIENNSNHLYNGVLSGYSYNSDISDITVEDSNIKAINNYNVGGLLGALDGSNSSLIDCDIETDVIAKGGSVGGLVGSALSSTIQSSNATGDVYVITGNGSGGLIGYAVTITSTSNYATGNIFSKGSQLGGLIGYSYSSIITSSYSTGYVSSTSNQVGGLIGAIYTNTSTAGSVNSCRSSSPSVKGVNYVGGLIGYISNSSSSTLYVRNSYSSGTSVTGTTNYVGGVIGYSYRGYLDNVYTLSSANMTVKGGSRVGGLIGWSRSNTIRNSKSYVNNVYGNSYTGGYIGYSDTTSISSPTVRISLVSERDSGYGYAIGGYIGYVYNSTVTAPSVSYVSGASIIGDRAIGGLIGYTNSSTLSGLIVSNALTVTGKNMVGGIVGYATGSSNLNNLVSNDINLKTRSTTSRSGWNSTHTCSGASYRCFGGVAGLTNNSTITSARTNNLYLSNTSISYFGGVSGYMVSSTITRSRSDSININRVGTISGGLAGYLYSSDVTLSTANGTIRSTDGNGGTGGISGALYNNSSIENSYFSGTVSTSSSPTGGIAGAVSTNSDIIRCYSKGTVSGGTSGGIVGGITGSLSGSSEISYSFSSSSVSAMGNAGGLVGNANNSNVKNSFFAGTVSAALSSNGGGIIGLSTGSDIEESIFAGSFSSSSTVSNHGGLIGYSNNSDVSNSYAVRNITGSATTTGGLIGSGISSSISDSYVKANVYGKNATGGISGKSSGASATSSFIYGDVYRNSSKVADDANYNIYGNNADIGTNAIIKDDNDAGDFLDAVENWSTSAWTCIKDDNMSPVLKSTAEIDSNKNLRGTGLTAMGFSSSTWNSRCSLSPTLDWEGKGNSNDSCSLASNCSGVEATNPQPDWTCVSGNPLKDIATSGGYYLLGRDKDSGIDFPELAKYQLLCISNHQTSSVLSGKYKLMTDVVFDGQYEDWYLGGSDSSGGSSGSGGSGGSGGSTPNLPNVNIISFMTSFISSAQAADIIAPNGWKPLGKSDSSSFEGTFDGNNHTISNLYINRSSTDYIGFFGFAYAAKISNLGIENANIIGKNQVGILAGVNDHDGGNVTRCHSTGTVKGNEKVGGLIGENRWDAQLSRSYSEATVTATGRHAGGLIGFNHHGSDITNCYATGNVSGRKSVGGLTGESWRWGQVTNCYSSGNVSGTGEVGGLIGQISKQDTKNSYTYWSISPKSTGSKGAIIGFYDGGSLINNNNYCENGSISSYECANNNKLNISHIYNIQGNWSSSIWEGLGTTATPTLK